MPVSFVNCTLKNVTLVVFPDDNATFSYCTFEASPSSNGAAVYVRNITEEEKRLAQVNYAILG